MSTLNSSEAGAFILSITLANCESYPLGTQQTRIAHTACKLMPVTKVFVHQYCHHRRHREQTTSFN